MSTLGDPKISGSGQRSNGWESIGKAFGSIREAIAKILAGHQERGKTSRLAPPLSPSYGSPARGSSAPSADTKVSSGTPARQGGGGINVKSVSPQQTQAYEALKTKYGEKRLQELGYTGPQDISAEKAREILLSQVDSPTPPAPATSKPAVAPASPEPRSAEGDHVVPSSESRVV